MGKSSGTMGGRCADGGERTRGDYATSRQKGEKSARNRNHKICSENQQRSFAATPRVCTAQQSAVFRPCPCVVSMSASPTPRSCAILIDAIDIRTWLLCHQLADARNVCRDRRQEDKPACECVPWTVTSTSTGAAILLKLTFLSLSLSLYTFC